MVLPTSALLDVDGRLGRLEAGPLLDALQDTASTVRTGALRALVRLPLDTDMWLEVGRFVLDELASPTAGDALGASSPPTIARNELVEAAVYVPIVAVRRQLNTLGQHARVPQRQRARRGLGRSGEQTAPDSSPDQGYDCADSPWQTIQLLANMPPVAAGGIIPVAYAYLAESLPSDERLQASNAILSLPEKVWQAFEPDVVELFEVYSVLSDEDAEVRWHLAWLMSRTGLRPVLAALAPRLAQADERARIAIVRLIEQAAICARLSHPPVLQRGATPPDIQPIDEPFLDPPWDQPTPLGDGSAEIPTRGASPPPPDDEDDIDPQPRKPRTRGRSPTPAEGASESAAGVAQQPEPRWLQGQVFEVSDEDQDVSRRRALHAGRRYRLRVRIGMADAAWISAPRAAPFPVDDLPPDQDEYELHVIFSEPNHVPQPLVATIYLPRWRGNSTTCEFQFRVREPLSDFQGRLVVVYGERVLQTMLLTATVVTDLADLPPEVAIEFKPETFVRANLADLDARRPFDIALVTDTGAGATTHLTEIAGQRIDLRSLENVDQPIRRMRRRLARIAHAPDEFPRDLNADATVDLLRFLARQGRLLYNGIVESQIGPHPLKAARRIQLVSARESFLPLEFLYDRPSPTQDATLCPNAKEALAAGSCVHCDNLDSEMARHYVCPLGFWGLSRVIERHAVRPVAETQLNGNEYALRADPIHDRDTLDILQAATYAASHRVRAGQIHALLETLVEVTDQGVEHVQDWAAWRQAILRRNPSILVLLPHTLEDQDYIPTLEIGKAQRLPEDQITADCVQADLDHHPPVVVLLGCETAVPDIPFQAFAAQFRLHGAAIVVSTLTPVLGRHAVPVAQILASELERVAQAGGTFGGALLGLRRRALAAGIPMVLSLVAYGDADWRLSNAIHHVQ